MNWEHNYKQANKELNTLNKAATIGIILAFLALTILTPIACTQEKPKNPIKQVSLPSAMIRQIGETPPYGIFELTYENHRYIIVKANSSVAITPLCNNENGK